MDEDLIKQIIGEIKILQERLDGIEKEQRNIREDILSGNPKERMQKRLLEHPKDNSIITVSYTHLRAHET